MDRFIVKNTCRIAATAYIFKIQYGQIYSEKNVIKYDAIKKFKIQYGQIYSNHDELIVACSFAFKIQYGQIYSLAVTCIFEKFII